MTAFNVLVVASPFLDKIADVPESFIAENTLSKGNSTPHTGPGAVWKKAKEFCKEPCERLGGSGTTVMAAMAAMRKLGTHFTLLGRVGDDKASKKIVSHLTSIGASPHLVHTNNSKSGKAYCFITPDRERTMLVQLGATVEQCANDFDKTVPHFNHMHLEGYLAYTDMIPACIEEAKGNHSTISLNLPTKNVVEKKRDVFLSTLPELHFLAGNLEEVLALTEKTTLEEALPLFNESQEILVTDGANPCWVKEKGQTTFKSYEVPPVHRVVNKTGAGDIWTGVYLSMRLQGKSVEECVASANRGARLWIQSLPNDYERVMKVFQERVTQSSAD